MKPVSWVQILKELFARICWSAYAVLLTQNLESSPLGTILLTLAATWVAGCLLTPDLSIERYKKRLSPDDWQAAMASLFSRWLVLCAAIFVLHSTGIFFYYRTDYLLLLLMAGLPLVLAGRRLIKKFLSPTYQRRSSIDIAFPLCTLGFTVGALRLGVTEPGALVSLVLLVLLLLILADWRHLPSMLPEVRELPSHTDLLDDKERKGGDIQLRYMDMIVLPLIPMQPNFAVPYLVARGMADTVGWVFEILERASEKQLSQIFSDKGRTRFSAAAARLNLGFLLAGGGVAIGILGIGPIVAKALNLKGDQFSEILLWLVVGQCAPAFFGATKLLMNAADMSKAFGVLSYAMAVTLAGALVFLSDGDPLSVARTYALLQLVFGALCAVILGCAHGVLPGLTALLYQRIRLF